MPFDEFDEAKYLLANPDVAVMIERGLFSSALDHWQRGGSLEHAAGRRRSGFYEHDRLYDEPTYLRLNPDVVALVQRRVIGSGYEHWMRHGRVEFARGRRHAPFVAGAHAFRPFRLSFPDGSGLLVARADTDPRSGAPLTLVHGDEPPLDVAASAVGFTEPLRVADVFRREESMRFLLVRLPAFASESRRPRPLSLSSGGPSPLAVSPDLGMQAFFFADAKYASAFLGAALGLFPVSASFADTLTEFVVGRLQPPRDPREPFSGFFLEGLARREGAGFDASGWYAPAGNSVLTVSVFCPDTREYGEVQSVTRVDRPDVLATLGPRTAGNENAAYGFRGFLPLPGASRINPARLVFGVTLENGAVRFYESRDASRLL